MSWHASSASALPSELESAEQDEASDNDVASNPDNEELGDPPPDAEANEEIESELEPWSDWIQRVTHKIEDQARSLNILTWVVKARALKWKLAQRVANHSTDRWTSKILNWDPNIHFDGWRCKAQRRESRPRLRWADDLTKYAQIKCGTNDWQALSQNSADWASEQEGYCNDARRQMGNESLE